MRKCNIRFTISTQKIVLSHVLPWSDAVTTILHTVPRWMHEINQTSNSVKTYHISASGVSRRISAYSEYFGEIIILHYLYLGSTVFWYTWNITGADSYQQNSSFERQLCGIQLLLTHCGLVDLRKWAIFNTILTSPKSWLSQEDLDAGCEHSLVPKDS